MHDQEFRVKVYDTATNSVLLAVTIEEDELWSLPVRIQKIFPEDNVQLLTDDDSTIHN